ncbi:hypothetical protein E0493_16875 [Roseomonas sp. M0104]|uniref:Uncharacterized protein n=1 Tax=Teichococcus coralli TaxID=2545983 RepID=A0A845BIM2_9PROT|nr:hypothetical protein [Pseudoroseomonas coralli]MXP65022.1 hypothetical protein [Pseudoroseomonas coralli]
MDMGSTLIEAEGAGLQDAFANLVAAHHAEASVRLRTLIAIGSLAGPEGRHAVAEELRTVFAEIQAVTTLGNRLNLAA